jgi:PHD/YefM family antitoxin component YafN of YafNO toxin-antitoxin module
VKEIHRNEEYEPVSLTRGNSQMAMIVSSAEYNALKDREDSEEILKDPKWIAWDQLQKQLKS